MNERIKELADEANPFASNQSGASAYYKNDNYMKAYSKKFAELIVNECASFVEPARKVGVMTKEPEKLPTYIKEYFGVK